MLKYQIYKVVDQDKTGKILGEYRLEFVQSSFSLTEIALSAYAWTDKDVPVIVITEPDPTNSWKNDSELISDQTTPYFYRIIY